MLILPHSIQASQSAEAEAEADAGRGRSSLRRQGRRFRFDSKAKLQQTKNFPRLAQGADWDQCV